MDSDIFYIRSKMYISINIHKITIEAHDGVFDGNIELAVHDRSELATIMNQLKTIDGIQEVQQIK